MSEIINGVASGYEIPREPKFYKNNVGLSPIDCNIPMPNVRQPISSGEVTIDKDNNKKEENEDRIAIMSETEEFLLEGGKRLQAYCDMPMSNDRQFIGGTDRICSTCVKEDVCMYKADLAQAAKEITQISERANVFIDTDIRCKKWSGKVISAR